MKVARILYPVTSLGPGQRVAVWTQGCSRCCNNCLSPTFQPSVGEDVDANLIAGTILASVDKSVTGITISGGEPLEQRQELLFMLRLLRCRFDDILLYTGFELEAVRSFAEFDELKSYVDVVITGPYVDELNDQSSALVGSSNQVITFFNRALIPRYQKYLKTGRTTNAFMLDDGRLVVVGIP